MKGLKRRVGFEFTENKRQLHSSRGWDVEEFVLNLKKIKIIEKITTCWTSSTPGSDPLV